METDAVDRLADSLFLSFRDYVERRISGLEQRLGSITAGPAGPQGRDGRDGIDGRDAHQLEVLDGIAVERSYPRGTVAAYQGGWIRAVRATDPLEGSTGLQEAGWHVLVRGIDDVELIQLDARHSVLRLRYSGGAIVEHALAWPTPVYCGVYESDRDYAPGDMVTFSGGVWHANVSTRARPGASEDWTQAVQRGRDGKAAR